MRLFDYLQAERGRCARVARELQIAPAYLSQMAAGGRPIPERLAARLEAATGNAVRRHDMFPDDWHRIWPELVGTDGAPDVPQAEAA